MAPFAKIVVVVVSLTTQPTQVADSKDKPAREGPPASPSGMFAGFSEALLPISVRMHRGRGVLCLTNPCDGFHWNSVTDSSTVCVAECRTSHSRGWLCLDISAALLSWFSR